MNIHDPNLRVVPQNIEAEQALLGAMLVNNAVHGAISRFLEADHFYEPIHRVIFEKAASLIIAGKTVTPVIIKGYLPEEWKNLQVDGEPATVGRYLAKLAVEAAPPAYAASYAMAVHDMWIAREALSAAQGAVDIILDIDPSADIIAQLEPIEERITSLRAQRIRGESRKGAGQEYLDELNAANSRGEVRGVPVCLPEIEEVVSEPSFEAGNLYGLLSSSGEGKTSLTAQQVHHGLERGHPVLVLSYDQSRIQWVRQMVAQKYGIEARRQRYPRLLSESEWLQCSRFANWIDESPFDVIKCSDHGAAQLVGFARTFVKRHGNGKVPLIVVDHIGSVRPEDKRADEGTKAKDINKIFKAGAEQTDAAWLVLNQRNSYGMRRDNPRPISADLFGGDPAKQAYDAIMYLYRQEKFKAERIATAASDADWKKINKVFGSEVEGIAEIGALKVRFGNPSFRKIVKFEDRFTRYVSQQPAEDQEGLGL